MNAILWKACPAATELEQVTAFWLLDWMGVEGAWFGMILDSATSGALQALVTARLRAEPRGRNAGASDRLVVYVSEQTHSSAEKATITAGIGQSYIRHVAVDSQFRMRTDALIRAIQCDVANDLIPFFVVATVGTTSSTAVDPVAEIAAVCREHRLWLHVDAAYGGPAMGLVCFRLRKGDDATREMMNHINSSGRFFVSHTVLGGRFTIRVAIGNFRTRQSDIEELWTMIAGASKRSEGITVP